MEKQKSSVVTRMIVTAVALALGVGEAFGAPIGPGYLGFNAAVDYTLPNYAYSPNLKKFVDTLPGLGAANANNLGNYIPVATPDTTTFPGNGTVNNPASDYYEIGLSQYNQRMHQNLPAPGTKLRGYYQKNGGAGADHSKKYLGPVIIAKTYDPAKPAGVNGNGKPVRLKFFNELPTGAAGNLFLPVDTMVMGAGTGPNNGNEMYTQNRATVHLHGGKTPWISDGTPHQWITPAGETTSYRKGISFMNVPDMINNSTVNGTAVPCKGGATCFSPALGDGIGTYYYTNQQSARLMFYHDHAYGLTRLNVYAGMAAGYLLYDQAEQDLIEGTNLSGVNPGLKKVLPDMALAGGPYHHFGIPLIIQDKSFVNDNTTNPAAGFPGVATAKTAAVDPLWNTYVTGSTGGDLWLPHEYMPNEDIYSPTGFNVMGRWDYGPFLAPPLMAQNINLPSPTIIPETYGDTMLVNGAAYPTVTLPKAPVRLRILNACNDRILNLQLYKADNSGTEVPMVPAIPGRAAPAYNLPPEKLPVWPSDGRDGGVPDPAAAGPLFYQIGNEGGLLPQVAVIPQQPIDYDYNRRSVTFGGIASKALFMAPAERADVIVDLSGYNVGDKVILYNDAPAPSPLFDARNDLYTGRISETDIGGAPATVAGFGPNTRTIMQIVIGAPAATAPDFSLANLQALIPAAYRATQPPPLVPEQAYNDAFPGTATSDIYANNVDETLNLTGKGQPVARVFTVVPGTGYRTTPTVNFIGGHPAGCVAPTCVKATATAALNGVTAITVTNGGNGYTTAPTVTITPSPAAPGVPAGGGNGATAVATVSGGKVVAITVNNPGSGYNLPPLITLNGGGGNGALAAAAVQPGSIGTITVTNGGAGYTSAPVALITGGGGWGAMAGAVLRGDTVMDNVVITEGFDALYGRMNARLGTMPNAYNPTAPAPAIPGLADYIDPPDNILTAGKTYIWRISHVGVDNHVVHFHLFDAQVINRTDWTNTILPPEDNELGWKESVKTHPFTDLFVAFRPTVMALPFPMPTSRRLLDATQPQGSTMNFMPIPPLPGAPVPAGMSNVMTDFAWEYVWHCHLLGHEENDMMRPIVFKVPTAIPPAPNLANPTTTSNKVTLTWTDASNDTNQTAQYRIERSPNTNTFTTLATINHNSYPSYEDTTAVGNTRYIYRITAVNHLGSRVSNTRSLTTPLWPATPVLNSPVGTAAAVALVATNNPTFSWKPSANTTSYTLRVTRGATVTNIPNLLPANICTPAVNPTDCSYTPAPALNIPAGASFEWAVSAAGANNMTSPWSTTSFCKFDNTVTPAAPTLVNGVRTVPTSTPAYQWNAVGIADSYKLYFVGGLNQTVTITPANAGCANGTGVCQTSTVPAAVSNALNTGAAVSWYVTASNSLAVGNKEGLPSNIGVYTLTQATIPPAAPATTAPTGVVAANAAGNFQWNISPGATSYTLFRMNFVNNTSTSTTYSAANICANNVCQVPVNLTVGMSEGWLVGASNAAGFSPWSAPLYFVVQ